MDISKLITRQTYLVPKGKEELFASILKELNKDSRCEELENLNIQEWMVNSRHGNSISYFKDPEYLYILTKGGFRQQNYPQNLPKLRTEFRQMEGLQGIRYVFNIYESCAPQELQIDITNSDEKGCRIEVVCIPILYYKYTKFKFTNFGESEIQDSNLVCERFLKTIFVGGLGANLISEKEQWNPIENATVLLINDVKSHQITKKLEEALDSATGEVLIMAWMGTILLTKLQALKEKGVKIKVITGIVKDIRQDVMQREKEKAFEELISIVGIENICTKRDFHGRAIIIDNKVFIGSMDLDSYSLTGTRNEFALYTEKVESVRTIRNYFNTIFEPLRAASKT